MFVIICRDQFLRQPREHICEQLLDLGYGEDGEISEAKKTLRLLDLCGWGKFWMILMFFISRIMPSGLMLWTKNWSCDWPHKRFKVLSMSPFSCWIWKTCRRCWRRSFMFQLAMRLSVRYVTLKGKRAKDTVNDSWKSIAAFFRPWYVPKKLNT